MLGKSSMTSNFHSYDMSYT